MRRHESDYTDTIFFSLLAKANRKLKNESEKGDSDIRDYIAENKPNWDDKYTRQEVDDKFSLLETSIDWKESVGTYDDIAREYPEPEEGWTVNVADSDYTYRYDGEEWIAISANAIPKATNDVDGLLTKEDHEKFDDAADRLPEFEREQSERDSAQDAAHAGFVESQSGWNSSMEERMEAEENKENSDLEHVEGEIAGLKESLDQEAAAARGAEEALRSGLEAESQRALAEEGRLSDALAKEKARAQAAEKAEEERAQSEEQRLEGKIDKEAADARAAEESLRGEIAAEAERAQGEEAGIKSGLEELSESLSSQGADLERKIQAEADRAAKAEEGLSGDIATEASRALAAEKAEQERATAEEQRLEGKIDKESADARAAEKRIADGLAAEESRAAAEEGRIEGLVTAEQAARSGKDAEHDAALESLRQFQSAQESTNGTLATKDELAKAVANAGHLKRSIVEILPEAAAADKDTIYMVLDSSSPGPDKYKEYMLIDGAMVQTGDTSADLTQYAKTADVDAKVSAAKSEAKAASDGVQKNLDAAKSALQGAIDAEEERALAAEGTIAGNLAAEADRAAKAENAEQSRATEAEAGIKSSLASGDAANAAALSDYKAANDKEVAALKEGKADKAHTHDYVPTSRKVNGKALTADVSIDYANEAAQRNVDFRAYVDAHAHESYNNEVKFARFFAYDDAAQKEVDFNSLHLPCIDSHIMIWTIDNTNVYIRAVAYSIRTDDIYTIKKTNSTWGDWVKIYTAEDKVGESSHATSADSATNATHAASADSAGKVANALTFTGASSAKYDGSSAQTVNIPTYSDYAGSAHGLVPAGDGAATKYLNAAGKWTVPPNTTYDLSQYAKAADVTALSGKALKRVYAGAQTLSATAVKMTASETLAGHDVYVLICGTASVAGSVTAGASTYNYTVGNVSHVAAVKSGSSSATDVITAPAAVASSNGGASLAFSATATLSVSGTELTLALADAKVSGFYANVSGINSCSASVASVAAYVSVFIV